MTLKARFVQFLKQKYPHCEDQLKGTSRPTLDDLVAENLLSPFSVTLPMATLEKLQHEIKMYFDLRTWTARQFQADYEAKGLTVPANYAVCNSFDFHIDDHGQPKLIEINTNAAFLAMGLLLYEFLQQKPATPFSEADLVEMFREESRLARQKTCAIAIMDENPADQRLFLEFVAFQQLFQKHGLKSKILDIQDLDQTTDYPLVYNRYTDFYLQEPKSQKIRELFNAKKICLSPSPWEYFLLADKKRMQQWADQDQVAKPMSLLKIYDLGVEEREQIWSIRKNLFFKPKNSFGSKQAYRGSSISHKTFDDFYGNDFIAQEYVQPAEIDVEFEGVPQKMKYDLRCYAYKDQLQLVVARLYQGQTTNLRTPGGGFAIVKFE